VSAAPVFSAAANPFLAKASPMTEISLLVRWTHVIAGIAWIGSSFYFVALDAGLRANPRLER
jgi:uncharacterized membrane protein